jgi:hypothetical protein
MPVVKYAKTPNGAKIVELETYKEELWRRRMLDQEVNMSLSDDMDQEDVKSEGENKEERWLLNTSATIHITHNK